MMPDYRRWEFAPQQLQRLGALVAQARVRLDYLRYEPEDREVRADLVRLTGALVGHADREDWHQLGDVAGSLVRLLGTRRADVPVFDAIQGGFDEIDRLIDERMART
jgi:hypothetical protein